MVHRRPNILVVMTDEERYPPVYETDAIREFRRTELPGQQEIRTRSTEFHRHYAASTACSPSRASLFTGHYPTLHGVRATDGAAKSAFDPAMFWLEPNTVPTMGNYFRKAGYRTFYRGKWHISHADLTAPDTRSPLASSDDQGAIIESITRLYQGADRLAPFGFQGWIGPEPHGMARSNCGLLRDPLYGDQVDALFGELEASADDAPWLLVAPFVNPHDIVLFGALWLSFGYPFHDDTVPEIPEPPTQGEPLRTKPSCQADYVDKYGKFMAPQPQIPAYRRFYYYLHKLVDREVQRVFRRLQASRFRDDTIVVYTSDHGDMLGAHGGMHQKWHNAYDESLRVPLLISGPGIPADARVDHPTSHVDLLPTLLGLAGIDAEAIRASLAKDHTEAQPLVGRDLSGALRGGALKDDPIYFMTEDEVSEGLDQTTLIGRTYEAVQEPAKVEAVVARLDAGDGPRLWKYGRSYTRSLIGDPTAESSGRDRSEYELYDLDADPLETNNLAHRGNGTRASRAAEERLEAVLSGQRAEKALHPKHR
ncbi:sulfatase-like hydrolase/transferase [Sorangium sp. So ce381]|uniref:sulfatase-like hydrolase/transferase n=1 Tax=Sorangium sp. So ce381 TaxID=3133307 RepID=UPI003F5BD35F